VWLQEDVLRWMQSKIDARTVGPMVPKVVIGPEDRFISKKELRGLVPYAVQYLLVLEHAGKFPGRIRIGENRSVWLEREVRDWMNARCGISDANKDSV
jgi:prophage regulatory protein